MQAIINQDVSAEPGAEMHPVAASSEPSARPELYLASIDLTERGFGAPEPERDAEPERHDEPGLVNRDPEIGFYQKRLAGLRDRLEKSGHPPE